MADRQPQDSREHWTRAMEARMDEQRDRLRTRDPAQVAQLSGAHWDAHAPGAGILALPYMQQALAVHVPDYAVTTAAGGELPTMIQALVMAYLVTADGTPRAGEWVAFRDLPDGVFYHRAFTGYTGSLLARALGSDVAAFERGALACGGQPLAGPGDAAFAFQVMPKLWLAAVYWLGDDADGFPPQASVLFDRAASHYLITDGLAIAGSQLARRILAQAGR